MPSTCSSRGLASFIPFAILVAATSVAAVSPGDLLHRSPLLFPRVLAPRVVQDIPLKITNRCAETIWPGIASQQGTGPGTGGFELSSGTSKDLKVGADWQGRVWGRTNCSFNEDGSGPGNKAGNNGGGRACKTGDCNGVLNCIVTGDSPATLAEFLLSGGENKQQTYYDISLVDGYNIPVGLTYLPGNSSILKRIPPNLTNCACIATTGLISDESSSNTTYPVPYNQRTTNKDLEDWCPWPLQVDPPTKPGDGVYPYPDDKVQRPAFAPCYSACAKTNKPSDCCTGSYNDPKKCRGGLYSSNAKKVCPDAYSFAYDDHTSTFIIPSGGGWEVTFCPAGRSTNILKIFGNQLTEVAYSGNVSAQVTTDTQNITIIQMGGSQRERGVSLGALVVMLAWACFW